MPDDDNRSVFVDLTGQRFNRLTVLRYVGNNRYNQRLWECACDCGNITVTTTHSLRAGIAKSCGCLKKEIVTKRINEHNHKHGQTKTRLYNIWYGMKARCKYPSHCSYKNYGGRGIKVCDEWENDFLKFRQWAMENGYDEDAPRGKCTLDRIDVDGDYEPSNCRWITQKEQMSNTRKQKVKPDARG